MLFTELFFNVIYIVRVLKILLMTGLDDLSGSVPLEGENSLAQSPAEMEKGLALESVCYVDVKGGNKAVFSFRPGKIRFLLG